MRESPLTQPKRPSSSTSSSSSPDDAAPDPEAGESGGSGGLGGLVMLTRERIEEALSDAVERGHMTRQAANDIAESLIARGRREASDVLSDVEQLIGRVRDSGRRAVGAGGAFPIEDYDDLTAAQITSRLDDLTPAELRKLRDYERRHGNRKSVLSAVEKKLR
jgi:hypothetical protein